MGKREWMSGGDRVVIWVANWRTEEQGIEGISDTMVKVIDYRV